MAPTDPPPAQKPSAARFSASGRHLGPGLQTVKDSAYSRRVGTGFRKRSCASIKLCTVRIGYEPIWHWSACSSPCDPLISAHLEQADTQCARSSISFCWSVSYTHLRAHETVLDLVC